MAASRACSSRNFGVLVLLLGSLSAQNPPAVPGATVQLQDEFATITFSPEGMALEEAIRFATEATQRAFQFKDSDFKGKPKIFLTGVVRIHRSRLYEFWQSVFVTQGFAMIPLGPGKGDFIMLEGIQNSQNLRQRATFVSVEQLQEYQSKVGEVIMTTISLKHVKVDQIRGAVTTFLNQRTAEFNADVVSANAIVVMGFAPTIYALYQVLMAMDQPTANLTLKFELLKLTHAVAEELQPIIQDLIQTGQSPGGAGQARAARVVQGENPLLPNQEEPEPKIIADPRTNSLVVYATDRYMSEIKRLIAALDTEVSGMENNIHIYWLKNTNARDMEETLRDLLQQSSSRSGRGSGIRPSGGNPAAGPSTTSESGREVTVVADENTNALLITCSKTRYGEIESLIKELDKRRPQVLVQAAIVELSNSDLQNISAEITAIEGGPDPRLGAATGFGLSTIAPISALSTAATGTGTGTGAGSGTGTGGGTGGVTAGNGSNPFNGLARIPFLGAGGISFTGLVAGVFEKNLNVPLLVSLLQSTTKSNLLSNASVLTNDNQEAKISVGREVPTSQNSFDPSGQSRSGFGNYQKAELALSISPHISNDNYLRLDIHLVVDAFVGALNLQSGLPPPKSTRSFTGSVTIPNGKTVVIGGLIQDNMQETVDKVPFLGDIPLLGELFKSRSTNVEKTNLYLFVTPTIFTDFKTLEDISYDKKLEINKLEGNVRLIDPNFRVVGLDQIEADLESIERSGNLDLPRYVPVVPSSEPMPSSDGIPVKPQAAPSDKKIEIHEGGTTKFRDGRAVEPAKAPGPGGNK